jgi:hypothetical protein
MEQIFGDFVERESDQEYLVIHFSPTFVPLEQRWRNTGLSADFLADYWTTFFPAHDAPAQERQREIKGAINFVANELLENVTKFSYKPSDYAVDLGLYLRQSVFRFYASNAIDPQAVGAFQARIQQLLTEDPGDLFLQQLEMNVLDEDCSVSRLGLLTMLNDYGARLAWKFETDLQDANATILTTMVELAVQ